jgi:membrane protease YdiL (CAAX protease family)
MQLVIRLFASLLLGMVVMSVLSSAKWLSPAEVKFLTLAVGTFSFHGVALILIYFFLRDQKMSWAEAFGFRSPALGRALLLALVVAVTVLPIAWTLGQIAAGLMSLFHIQPVTQSPVEMLQTAGSRPTKLLIGLLAIVVAPVVEELVFRGLIYPTLKQLGSARMALWGTSLLFAFIHLNVVTFLPLTFLAIVLALLYESTDNLLTPICTHSLFNLFNYILVLAQPFHPSPFSSS